MSCPFKIYNNCCRLQISHIETEEYHSRRTNEYSHTHTLMRDICVGEDKCPIMKK